MRATPKRDAMSRDAADTSQSSIADGENASRPGDVQAARDNQENACDRLQNLLDPGAPAGAARGLNRTSCKLQAG